LAIATRTKGEASTIDNLMKKAEHGALLLRKNQGRNQATHIDDHRRDER